MSGMNYLTIAYLGMIVGLGVWTWTVVSRSRKLESRLAAMEESLGLKILKLILSLESNYLKNKSGG